MSRDIARLTALVLILIATFSTVHAAKRVLLPPPDGYKGVEINGVKYVVGQVYVPQFADTTALKEYGFRSFDAVGSTVYYKKVKAVWPLDTDLRALPDIIVGLTYEKARSVEEMERAYATDAPRRLQREELGIQYNNYNYGWMNNGTYNDNRSYQYGYGHARDCYPSPTSRFNYNEYGYRYNTLSPTLLTPSTIASYPRNKFTRHAWRDCR